MRKTAMIAASLLFLAGCASGGGDGPAQRGGPSISETRGREIAELRCSVCHAIGPGGVSPRTTAPPFRNLSVRFNALTFERVMADIAKGGHGEMPALSLDEADVRDVRAYIQSLN